MVTNNKYSRLFFKIARLKILKAFDYFTKICLKVPEKGYPQNISASQLQLARQVCINTYN